MPTLLQYEIGLAVACLIAILSHHVYLRIFRLQHTPAHLPWAGPKRMFFSRGRLMLSSIFQNKELSEDGYHKYSKNNQYYVLPNLLTGPEVIVPPSQLRWLLQQPEEVLSQNKASREFIEASYTLLNPSLTIQHTTKDHILRRNVAKEMDGWTDTLVEEMQLSLAKLWGEDTEEWKDIHIFPTLVRIFSSVINRVLIGMPLCRNEDYNEALLSFGTTITLNAAAINLLPFCLKPIFGPLITIYDRIQYWKCRSFLRPIILERMSALEISKQNPDSKYQEPNDAIQWYIHESMESWTGKEYKSVETICESLVALVFVSVQTSAVTLCNSLFDIASLPNPQKVVDILRDEASIMLESGGGAWNKNSISKLVHHDSVIRESLRLWDGRGPLKEVVAEGGISTPDGLHLPKGCKVGISASAVHTDGDIYESPTVWDPFRFSTTAEEKTGKPGPSIVTTSGEFMAFGHGRASCPGRFFASNQMKLLLAHIMLWYDIEPVPVRPVNLYFATSVAPPIHSNLRIRRRRTPNSYPPPPTSPI